MIEITDRFTSITAKIAPNGMRVTLEFSREIPLPPDQPVRVRYESGDGTWRGAVGIARPTYVEARWRRAAVHHYRLSHWIAADAPTERGLSSGVEEPRGDPIRV